MKKFEFNGLFIFDMANNHQGDLQHGLNIIKAMGEVSKKGNVRGALKFQFRHLDTFIHPEYKERKNIKHINRFMSTRLNKFDFEKLTDEVRKQGMTTICTPFDEESVDLILDLGIDVIKIASCSASDMPLLEYVANTNRSVVVSTAGLNMNQIDRIVSLFEYRGVHFALMHCVAIYPTPYDKLKLNQINLLRSRFPQVPVGFSTHEEPENYSAIKIAYAKGARLFERHVGLKTNKYKFNAYSSEPKQVAKWIQAYHEAVEACGGEQRPPASPEEINSLRSLLRGTFARKKINKGDEIKRENIFFAMPLLDDQLSSGEWQSGLTADKDYAVNEPLKNQLANLVVSNEELIFRIMLQVKGMLNKARIFIGLDSSVEISHHYGLERFREFGAVIITCVNRAYCKKLIIQLPRQKHPYHFHRKKEETFQLLYGDLEVELEGKRTKLQPGDKILIMPNMWHKFHTLDGVIFEEISTKHYNGDSIYEDERISRLPRQVRKTNIPNWELAVETGLI